jgi:ElaB/YqjD/DUF883 family membrane-anchored ribosome-binding protein
MSKTKTTPHSSDDLKKHALSLLNATSHVTDHKVAEARDKLAEIIEAIGDGVEKVEDAALEKVKEAKHYVREHPYKSVGIVIGICAFIGLVMTMRKK